jgi:branched-subunit amino acid transport protein
MSPLELILTLAAGIFGLRLAGLTLGGATLPPTVERALGFVPVATLTALIVSSLVSRLDEGPSRLIAAAMAGLVMRRTGKVWVCILVGVAVYWPLRLVGW